jgi:hypothetical protein
MSHDIFIFGSLVRGEVSRTSDSDVLVIPVGGAHRDAYPAGWSVYQRGTIKSYFDEGRLFAWHLHLESRCVFSAGSENWLQIIGAPASYRAAKEDVLSLTELLADSLDALRNGSNSEIYELGICYTALRDIAMSASWQLMGRPSFSRDAPFMLPISVPLSKDAYAQAMGARHYSTRGGATPKAVGETVKAMLEAPLIDWARTIGDSL